MRRLGKTSRVLNVLTLQDRRLYLCVGLRDDMSTFLPAVLEAGVDVVQLREKTHPFEDQLDCARLMLKVCRDHGVPFIMNDSPESALEIGADGVHVGQDDISVARCREILGTEAIIGLSTHSDSQFSAALLEDASYLSAGPIVPTPTKPGREGTGLSFAVKSQLRSDGPVFVTGGVNLETITELVEAGLRHFVVVRAITQSNNPGRSAREIRHALDNALSAVAVEPTQ